MCDFATMIGEVVDPAKNADDHATDYLNLTDKPVDFVGDGTMLSNGFSMGVVGECSKNETDIAKNPNSVVKGDFDG